MRRNGKPAKAARTLPLLLLLLAMVLAVGFGCAKPAPPAKPPAPSFGTVRYRNPSGEPLPTREWGPVARDQILVVLKDGAKRDAAEAAAKAAGGSVVGEIAFIDAFQVEIPSADASGLADAVREATAVAGVEAAMPSQMAFARLSVQGVPCNALRDAAPKIEKEDVYSQAMVDIGAERAWTIIEGAGLPMNDVTVAIVDEAVHPQDPRFSGDVTFASRTPAPPGRGSSHGDSVSQVIAMNPKAYKKPNPPGLARILGAKLKVSTTDVFGEKYGFFPRRAETGTVEASRSADPTLMELPDGGGTYSVGPIAAMLDQIENGATVVNMSWGGTAKPALVATYRRFFEKMAKERPDVVFVAAAPNARGPVDGDSEWPSGLRSPNMITVGNVWNGKPVGGLASDNYELTLSAPGDSLGGGTSHAAPQVTSAVAMMKALNPKLTAAEIKRILVDSASPTVRDLNGATVPFGGRFLAIDKAVLAVVNKLRADAKLSVLTMEEAERLFGVGLSASSGKGTDWVIVAQAGSDRGAGVDLGLQAPAGTKVSDPVSQKVAPGGTVKWTVTPPLEGAIVHVKRADNGGGSHVVLGGNPLVGTWEWTPWFPNQVWTYETGVDIDKWEWKVMRQARRYVFELRGADVYSVYPKGKVGFDGTTVTFEATDNTRFGMRLTGTLDGDTISGTAIYTFDPGPPLNDPPPFATKWKAKRVK